MLSEREARFRTRTLGWICVVAVLISLFAYGFSSVTFYLAAIIPWIAALVYRTGQGAIHLLVGKGDPRPNVAHAYMFAIIFPGIWAIQTAPYPISWGSLLVVALIVGTLLAAVAVRDRRHWAEFLLLTLFNSFYGLGLAVALNQDLDRIPPTIQRAYVLAKRETRGRGARHYLRLGPWGPRPIAEERAVSVREYRLASKGQVVCIDLHSGTFGARWIEIKSCEPEQR